MSKLLLDTSIIFYVSDERCDRRVKPVPDNDAESVQNEVVDIAGPDTEWELKQLNAERHTSPCQNHFP